jgi:hypothetical protein
MRSQGLPTACGQLAGAAPAAGETPKDTAGAATKTQGIALAVGE